MTNYSKVQRRTEEFHIILNRLTNARADGAQMVFDHDRSVPAWVLTERAALLDFVNTCRAERGLPLVDADAIRRIENTAVGHSDYGYKLALRCARLSLGEED